MDYKLVWLNTSIFCCRAAWHHMLRKAIMPFVISQKKEGMLDSFQIQLNYSCGENIRLSLLTREERAEELARKADAFFKATFSALKIPKNDIELPVASLFLPFPPNTIQYGLYKLSPAKNTNAFPGESLSTELSLLMIEAIAEECVDEETIITFAFYLHLVWLKILIQHHIDFDIIKRIYCMNAAFEGQSENMSKYLKEKFEDNKTLLFEIKHDLMGLHPLKTYLPPNWLNKWRILCEEKFILAKRQNNRIENEIGALNKIICQTIDNTLGITETMRLTLSYFIKNALLK